MSANPDDPTFLDRCSPAYRRAVQGHTPRHVKVIGYSVRPVYGRRVGSVQAVQVRLVTGTTLPIDIVLSPALARDLAADLMLPAIP